MEPPGRDDHCHGGISCSSCGRAQEISDIAARDFQDFHEDNTCPLLNGLYNRPL